MAEVKRLFLALPLSEEWKQVCLSLRDLNAGHKGIRWVPVENLHITACFLGDKEIADIPDIKEKAADIAHQTDSFTIEMERFVFRPVHKPRMIWMKGKRCPDYSRLNLQLEQAMNGREPRKPALPHITMAGFRHAPHAEVVFPESSIERERIRKMILFESRLEPFGARYFKIGEWDFA